MDNEGDDDISHSVHVEVSALVRSLMGRRHDPARAREYRARIIRLYR